MLWTQHFKWMRSVNKFFKIPFLNLMNSVNLDKIQKWCGYQAHLVSDNKYIPRIGKASYDYPEEETTASGNVCIVRCLVAFGFCHNSLNSVKVIQGELHCDYCQISLLIFWLGVPRKCFEYNVQWKKKCFKKVFYRIFRRIMQCRANCYSLQQCTRSSKSLPRLPSQKLRRKVRQESHNILHSDFYRHLVYSQKKII